MEFLKNNYFKSALIVIGIIFVISILSKWTESSTPNYTNRFQKQIKSILEQASRWHVLSKQDSNPVLSIVHADYALAYVNILRQMLSEEDLARLTDTNISEFIYLLEEDQKKAIQHISDQCPHVKPEGTYAINSGWI